MSRRISLFVLIDALGWFYAEQSRFLAETLPHRIPLRTVLGYSAGAIPTILTGRTPAEHGHWNLFYRDPVGSPFRWLQPLRALPARVLDHRITRRLVTEVGRRVLGLGALFECAVSPRLLPQLSWVEKRNIYGPGGIEGTPTIFDQLERRGVSHRVYSYHRFRDQEILTQAQRDIEQTDATFFFLYLCEVDALLHAHCLDRSVWEPRLATYAADLDHLLAVARRHDPGARMTVLSDHGMTPVRQSHDLVREVESLGLSMPDDYLAVYDSTMARFWFFSDAARERILGCLRSLGCGRILADAELHELGVLFPDRRYGEVIVLLDPGWILAGSDFNGPRWCPAGMHGYHPDDPWSDGVFLTTHAPAEKPRSIVDIHGIMLQAAAEDAAR